MMKLLPFWKHAFDEKKIIARMAKKARNGHSESFSHSKKVPKLTEGKIFHPFFGLFWGSFGPVMALFGGVL